MQEPPSESDGLLLAIRLVETLFEQGSSAVRREVDQMTDEQRTRTLVGAVLVVADALQQPLLGTTQERVQQLETWRRNIIENSD